MTGGAARSRNATVLDPVLHRAATHPDDPLFAFYGADGRVRESYSYGSFARRTNDIAVHLLRERACGPGDRVLLVYPPGLEILCAFFACLRMGAIPVPVSPPSSQGFAASMHRMNHISRDCSATAALTDRAYFWSLKLRRLRARIAGRSRRMDHTSDLRWIVTSEAAPSEGEEVRQPDPELLFLQYTSGSTRDPRGVMVTHRNVLHNGEVLFPEPPVGVSWLPQYHDMGLIGGCLFGATRGGTSHLLSPVDFLRRPAVWLELVGRVRATASAAPNFAYEFCLRDDRLPDEELEGIDLRSLRVLMNGAEPVRADTVRRFEERFGPCGLRRGVLGAAYGLAEHTLAVSFRGTAIRAFDCDRLASNEAIPCGEVPGDPEVKELVSCGRPLGDTDVRIVDVSRGPVEAAPGTVGEIWVDGPSKCLGYWNRPDLTSRTFEARLGTGRDRSARWLRTGDLGFMHQGELFVCGRLKDLIIVRGMNYYPQDIEAVVEEHPGLRNGCVAAFAVEIDGRETLAIVAELRGATPPGCTEDINRGLRDRLGIVAETFTYIAKRTIPKTSSGKIMRHEVRRRWLDGGLDVVARVDCRPAAVPAIRTTDDAPVAVADTAWGTAESLDRTFRRRGLTGTEDGTLADIGLDSMAMVEFAVEVEKHLEAAGAHGLGGSVDLRWLQRVSVSELSGLLHEVIAAAPGARLRFRKALAELREEQMHLERHMMEEDAGLGVPGSTARGHDRTERSSRRGILLTGGTGFFGPFLLRSLLQQSDAPIYVLVRARNEGLAYDRLDGAIASLGPDLRTHGLADWRERVVPVCGDLTQHDLGLSRANWRRLAENTDVVYHNAAWVNYLLDYEELRPANVLGTRTLVRFATDRIVKVVNHVSTTFVFGWSTRDTLFERDTNQDLSLLDFGYSQSKWVAEQILFRAMKGGLPARVFRPALIAPSTCGSGEHFDIAMRLIAFMVKYGLSTTAQNQVSLSPADLVADNIVAISGLPDTVGQTFHVTRDRRSTMRDITDLLTAQTGRAFAHLDLADFVAEVVARCGRDDLLFPLLNFLVRSVDKIAAMEVKLYDNANFRGARDRSPFGREDPPLEDVVGGIVRFLGRHGLVEPRAPGSVARPAHGAGARHG